MLEKRKRKITFDSRRDNFLLKNVKTRHKFIYDEEANIIRENRALPVYEYTWIGTSLEGSNFPKVLLLGPTLITLGIFRRFKGLVKAEIIWSF